MRVALYARVSTADQVTIPHQLDQLRELAAARGWTIAAELAETAGGTSKARPARDQVLQLARRRRIDAVLVWKLDRWGRSLAELAVSLDDLVSLGVAFVSLTEALDLTTPGGRAMAGMLSVFAQFERDTMRERIKAGIANARRRGTRSGKAIGRPATAAARAAEVWDLRRSPEHPSPGRIAQQLGLSRTSVLRILHGGGDEPCSASWPASRRRPS